ncbi:hypothetical protein QJS66_21295 [Kocuria rhizophila]|nr:hypothetical protein QJS66_21295 [Kocuria rhizophila]
MTWPVSTESARAVNPPREDQDAIAKYLAHANVRIDKAIAAKRRLISLLDEAR